MELLDNIDEVDKKPKVVWQLVGLLRMLGIFLLSVILLNNIFQSSILQNRAIFEGTELIVVGFILFWILASKYHIQQAWREIKLSRKLVHRTYWRYVGVVLPLLLVSWCIWRYIQISGTFLMHPYYIRQILYLFIPSSLILLADVLLIANGKRSA